jgi:hypothetical protein
VAAPLCFAQALPQGGCAVGHHILAGLLG